MFISSDRLGQTKEQLKLSINFEKNEIETCKEKIEALKAVVYDRYPDMFWLGKLTLRI